MLSGLSKSVLSTHDAVNVATDPANAPLLASMHAMVEKQWKKSSRP